MSIRVYLLAFKSKQNSGIALSDVQDLAKKSLCDSGLSYVSDPKLDREKEQVEFIAVDCEQYAVVPGIQQELKDRKVGIKLDPTIARASDFAFVVTWGLSKRPRSCEEIAGLLWGFTCVGESKPREVLALRPVQC